MQAAGRSQPRDRGRRRPRRPRRGAGGTPRLWRWRPAPGCAAPRSPLVRGDVTPTARAGQLRVRVRPRRPTPPAVAEASGCSPVPSPALSTRLRRGRARVVSLGPHQVNRHVPPTFPSPDGCRCIMLYSSLGRGGRSYSQDYELFSKTVSSPNSILTSSSQTSAVPRVQISTRLICCGGRYGQDADSRR